MIVKKFEPTNILLKAIDYIWVVESDFLASVEREDIIMPLGHVNIIFNYASDYMLIEENEEIIIPNAVVIGQIKRAKHIQYGQKISQIGISLKPEGFMILFGKPSIAITEQIINATDFDPTLDQLYKEIRKLKEIEQKIKKINEYLLSKMSSNQWDSSLIEKMVAYVESNCEKLNISQMAEVFHTSISSVERYFKKYIGLTPKVYGNIYKFRKNIEDKMLRKDIQNIYYDQSHLIKQSKKFTGKTINDLENVKNELTLQYIIKGEKS